MCARGWGYNAWWCILENTTSINTYKQNDGLLSWCITSKSSCFSRQHDKTTCSSSLSVDKSCSQANSSLLLPGRHPALVAWQSIPQPAAAQLPAGSVRHREDSSPGPLTLESQVPSPPRVCSCSCKVCLCNSALSKAQVTDHQQVSQTLSWFRKEWMSFQAL